MQVYLQENKASTVIVDGVTDGRVWKGVGGQHRTSRLETSTKLVA